MGEGIPQPSLYPLQSRTPQDMSYCWFRPNSTGSLIGPKPAVRHLSHKLELLDPNHFLPACLITPNCSPACLITPNYLCTQDPGFPLLASCRHLGPRLLFLWLVAGTQDPDWLCPGWLQAPGTPDWP
uniref:Uncharacterized protein n=1 Tax=Pipistrellus kuhlii TaxID=59472 RepID=A0A7J8A8B7_PIPKU|nr:hypothetical protein mPipKuh1_008944 [Pipistrellus kuhlii]